ncbi:MAG: FprA family A-type flavoprotein [Lachnospiraceae bacterium]
MKPVINDNIKYLGCFDSDLDLFEGQYPIPDGISYNSYAILDEKVVIMDTIDIRKTDEWLNHVNVALKGRIPDYLVISHMEPDHSASIFRLVELYPDIQIVGNAKTFTILSQFFPVDFSKRQVLVKDGDTLNIGTRTLHFLMAPMIHWPEVMMTYVDQDKLLFSADAFGKFGSYDVDDSWVNEARRYYLNIVGKYGAQVQNILKKLPSLNVEVICPLHGPVLSQGLETYLGKYNIWSSYEPEESGVLIAYASIYGNTGVVARQLAELLRFKGESNVVVRELNREDLSSVLSDAFRYDRIIFASSTYDGGVFPAMERFLLRLAHKGFRNRHVGIIENGTWAPMAAKKMHEIIDPLKDITYYNTEITIKSSLNDETLAQLKELAKEITNIE